MRRSAVALLLAAATLAACGQQSNDRPDGASDAEAPHPEAAAPETSALVDAHVADAQVTDAHAADATVLDATSTDGAADAAATDATVAIDASTTDATDAPPLDASAIDTMATDMSATDTATCNGPGARFITDVVAHQFGGGQTFGQDTFPANVLGPPHGAGCCAGSLDVVSLGDGGSVTVAFAGNAIIDGPGPDFLVFENAFELGGNPSSPYAEPGIVEVSQDGASWVSYPCTATSYPYGTCAGWHPVYANPSVNTIDPTDPATAGGDPFDLADVGLAWARYVRVTDRAGDGLVFDLDAIAVVNPVCP